MIEFLLFFILGGLFAGFTAGIFGLGGGAVLVPLFLILLPKLGALPDVVMHQAVSTSLAIIVPGALIASKKQYNLGNLQVKPLKEWFFFVLIGICIMTLFFRNTPTAFLQIIFILYLIACAGYIFFKKLPVLLPHEKKDMAFTSKFLGGVFVGGFASLLGIGGGTFIVPFYLAHHYSLKSSIAISTATSLWIGFGGAVAAIITGYHQPGLASYSLGYINVLAFLMITPFSMFAAIYGVKTSHFIHEKLLKILYISFLLMIAIFMYYETFGRV